MRSSPLKFEFHVYVLALLSSTAVDQHEEAHIRETILATDLCTHP